MAAIYNLEIEQYVPFQKVFTYSIDGSLVNLTGYTALAQIRDANGLLLTSFSITLGGALGTIALDLTKEQVALIKAGSKWDLIITPSGGSARRLLQGDVSINLGVTRNGS